MNVAMKASALSLAGPVAETPREQQFFRPINWRIPIPVRPVSLPLAASRNGSLFTDPNVQNLHWYLPDFALAPDVDGSFAFAASQKSQQQDGSPFNLARVSLRVVKSMPADAAQYAQANPAATMKEIPLENLAAMLVSPYTDSTGQEQTRSFPASSLSDNGDGSFGVVFDGAILGNTVVAVYQDLRVFGKASVTLSASFQAWAGPGAPAAPGNLNVSTFVFPVNRMAQVSAVPRTRDAVAATPMTRALFYRPFPYIPDPPDPPNPPAPQLVETALPFTKALALGLKYNQDGYQLQYTVTTLTSPSRVILSADDLNGFNAAQSQYVELKELGDINAKYPSISRAYLGVLSRTIVVIPQRYSIVRSKAGCAATCLARVDSSAASTSQCAFEFTFVIGPEVNRVELAKFQNDLHGVVDLSSYSITFASLLRDTPASTLVTSFKSTAEYSAGADPHTFSLTVSVQDDGPRTPAVANANLFILRLCSQTGTDLIGSLSVKLDDGFTDPVLATVDLNFGHTTGTDELSADLDPTVPAMNLSNLSSLDLQIQDYALMQGTTLTEVAGAFVLPGRSGKALPVPADNAGMALVAAAQLALPTPMTIAAAPNYLNFLTVDVQQTRYLIAIDASGVDFGKVASIVASVTLPSLPAIAPLKFALGSILRADSQHVLIPLVNAMSTMPGSVDVTVTFIDITASPIEFTVTTDFVSEPVLTIVQDEIAAHLPPA